MSGGPAQIKILDLLTDLRAAHDLIWLMVSHDPAVINHMCSDLAMMRHGEIIGVGHARLNPPHLREALAGGEHRAAY